MNVFEPEIAHFVLVFIGFLFSIIVHECAHGIAALWCGDETAFRLGRITLNPLSHIDPFMSIMLPVVLALTHQPIFGGALPVPVVLSNLRHPRRDQALVALAGPASNLILAALFTVALNPVRMLDTLNPQFAERLHGVVAGIISCNVVLALFNMLPIPPLDGSKVLAGLLHPEWGFRLLSVPPATGFLLLGALIYADRAVGILTPLRTAELETVRFLVTTLVWH
jgi:Zn-dependent protease